MENNQKCVYKDCNHQVYTRDNNNSTCVFHCDKSNDVWKNPFSVNVKEFWQAIRQKIKNEQNDESIKEHLFKGYTFATMEPFSLQSGGNKTNETVPEDGYFFYKNSEPKLLKSVKFKEVSFPYKFELWHMSFEQDLEFSKCTFNEGIQIFATKVHGKHFHITDCNFKMLCYVMMSSFDNLWFMSNSFEFGLHIQDSSINRILCEFDHITNGLVIDKINKLQAIELSQVRFKDNATVNLRNFAVERLKLDRLSSNIESMKITDIQVIKQIILKNLNFNNTDFNGLDLQKVKNIDMQNVSFHGAILNEIEWGDIKSDRFKTSQGNESDYYPTGAIERSIIRQIKYILDSQEDIISANKFYGLEMKLYNASLSWENFFDKVVFYFHEAASNHAQSWALPLLWIFVLGFIFSGANALDMRDVISGELSTVLIILMVIPLLSVSSLYFIRTYPLSDRVTLSFSLLICSYLFYYWATDMYSLDAWIDMVKPIYTNQGDEGQKSSMLLLFTSKVVIFYLIYQSIIAMRKDTKRK